jgi:hypothetical protein
LATETDDGITFLVADATALGDNLGPTGDIDSLSDLPAFSGCVRFVPRSQKP